MQPRKPYPSDISREQFELVRPLLESARKRTKPRTVDQYEVFNAVLYLLKSGCQWRMLGQLHQAVQALFGWGDSRPHRFVFRGRSLGASATTAASSLPSAEVPLSEFKLLVKERFFYDYGFDDINVPVWRHDIRFEAALVVDRERLPHCIGGVGSPPLEQTGSPQELSNLAGLFTPQFVLNQLTELVDRGSSDAQLAQHLRHLRPRLTAERFSQESANRRLLASHGGAE